MARGHPSGLSLIERKISCSRGRSGRSPRKRHAHHRGVRLQAGARGTSARSWSQQSSRPGGEDLAQGGGERIGGRRHTSADRML
jgi:hypothetical protein